MKKSEYQQLLRDPRWQKKRLVIMERDGFECRDCGDGTKTLNVHHVYYESGRAPWEYCDLSLITLCEDCHEEDHRQAYEYEKALSYRLKRVGIRPGQMAAMAFTIERMAANLGEEKTKELVEKLDLIAFRISDDASLMEQFESFLKSSGICLVLEKNA